MKTVIDINKLNADKKTYYIGFHGAETPCIAMLTDDVDCLSADITKMDTYRTAYSAFMALRRYSHDGYITRLNTKDYGLDSFPPKKFGVD